MSVAVTWFLTEVIKAPGDSWSVSQGGSRQAKVWFGTQVEWAALTSAERSPYDIYIFENRDTENLVDADELRAALMRYNGSYQFSDNAAYLGKTYIHADDNPDTENMPSFGLGTDGSEITTAQTAVIITMQPIKANSFNARYQGDVGKFDPFRPAKLTPPCFTRGTMIWTPCGEVPIETLRRGDMVMTLDHGAQPISLILSVTLSAEHLHSAPELRPVRIARGALGPNLPKADLLVSQQHRVLIRSRTARRMFGVPEILVAAKQLLTLKGIELAEVHGDVEYYQILFDRHELLLANGAETESLYTDQEALKSVGAEALEKIYQLFPQLRNGGTPFPPARLLASARSARKLAIRHAANHRQLVM